MLQMNFPERKRQRQIVALENLLARTGLTKTQKGEVEALKRRTKENKRGVRTKKLGGKEERIARWRGVTNGH